MKRQIKFLSLLMFFSLSILTAKAQEEFTFDYLQAELDQAEQSSGLKPHFLGEEFALKLQLLRESYTYKEMEEISLKETTIIEKPSPFDIYFNFVQQTLYSLNPKPSIL